MRVLRFITSTRRRFLLCVLPLLAVIFAFNHLEYRWRLASVEQNGANGVVIRAETGVVGHNTIGIDENSISAAGATPFLRFALLADWPFDIGNRAPCPQEIRALDGKEAQCIGFMYPLEAGARIRSFCLLRTTQTCCYGPRPQFSQYILVEMDHPVEFERLAPVLVTGKFFVDPQPDQGYIYRMEGSSVATMGEDEPDINASDMARKAGLPLFDWSVLHGMEAGGAHAASVPKALQALSGKPVVVEGFVVNRFEETPPRVLVSTRWWDGTSLTKAPGVYDALVVTLQDKRQLPPVWKQKGVFTGTLRVENNPSIWPQEGVVTIQKGVRGVSSSGGSSISVDPGPFLEPVHEAAILAVFLYYFWRIGKRRPAS